MVKLRRPDVSSPNDCRFSDSHEWFRVDGDEVTVGISSFAADELTDITFVEMKPIGTTITTGGSIGEVESVKATSDVFSVIGGQISAVNETVTEDPALVNTDSYGEGWLVKLKSTDLAPLDDLMDWTTYSAKHPVG